MTRYRAAIARASQIGPANGPQSSVSTANADAIPGTTPSADSHSNRSDPPVLVQALRRIHRTRRRVRPLPTAEDSDSEGSEVSVPPENLWDSPRAQQRSMTLEKLHASRMIVVQMLQPPPALLKHKYQCDQFSVLFQMS